MKSKGESVCREVGQAKCCAATRWQEEVKEVKSDFVARLPGGFEVGELLLGGVCVRGRSSDVSGKGRTLLCCSFPICRSCRRRMGRPPLSGEPPPPTRAGDFLGTPVYRCWLCLMQNFQGCIILRGLWMLMVQNELWSMSKQLIRFLYYELKYAIWEKIPIAYFAS